MAKNSYATIVPYPIVLEAATTLARDKTIKRPDLAYKLLQDYSSVEEKPFYDSNVESLVAKLYNPRTSKRNSPFDHYVLALAKKNDIKLIFSFDSFYKKNGLTLMKDVVV
ncbi:MAG: PIN domain-containing protein [Candidatus Levybacteria bacterium]|nr:PIN domain-containing protein [Candidatus Levybacteria bacterium]